MKIFLPHKIEDTLCKLDCNLGKFLNLNSQIHNNAREALRKENYEEAWKKYTVIQRNFSDDKKASVLSKYAYACYLIEKKSVQFNEEIAQNFCAVLAEMTETEYHVGIGKKRICLKYGSHLLDLNLLKPALEILTQGLNMENDVYGIDIPLRIVRAKVWLRLGDFALAQLDLEKNTAEIEKRMQARYVWVRVNHCEFKQENDELLNICNWKIALRNKFTMNLFAAVKKTSDISAPEVAVLTYSSQ